MFVSYLRKITSFTGDLALHSDQFQPTSIRWTWVRTSENDGWSSMSRCHVQGPKDSQNPLISGIRTYTYAYTYTYIYIHTYAQTCTYRYIHTHTWKTVCRMESWLVPRIYLFFLSLLHVYIYIWMYIYTYIHMHKYIHTYLHTYIPTYLHTYIQTDRQTDIQT